MVIDWLKDMNDLLTVSCRDPTSDYTERVSPFPSPAEAAKATASDQKMPKVVGTKLSVLKVSWYNCIGIKIAFLYPTVLQTYND